MATEVYSFQITIPAGTPQSAPVSVAITMPAREVESINVKVPPGPSGLMGFALTMNGRNVVPIVQGTYIVTDDRDLDFPLTGLPNSGQWQVTGYNTDIYDHSIYVEFHAALLSSLQPDGGISADASATDTALQIAGG